LTEEFIVLDESDDQQIVNLPPRAYSFEERERKSHHWHSNTYVIHGDVVKLSKHFTTTGIVNVTDATYKKFLEIYKFALPELLNIFSNIDYEELVKLSLEIAKKSKYLKLSRTERLSAEDLSKLVVYIYCRRHNRYYILPSKLRGFAFRFADLYHQNGKDQRYELAAQMIHKAFSEDPMLLRASLAILSWIKNTKLLGSVCSMRLALVSMRIATILTNTYLKYQLTDIIKRIDPSGNTLKSGNIAYYIRKLGISYRANSSYSHIYSVDVPSDLCLLLERMDVPIADYVRCI